MRPRRQRQPVGGDDARVGDADAAAAHGNFEQPPRAYRDPYDYSVPGAAADFLPQNARTAGS